MIICVGFPGVRSFILQCRVQTLPVLTTYAHDQSGKSTFTKRNLVPQGYVHINQDTLHTKSACLQATDKALAQGKRCATASLPHLKAAQTARMC